MVPGYVELTSAFDGRPLLLAVELVGEIRDNEVPLRGKNVVGRSMLIHTKNRRVSWRVEEPYRVVVERLATAKGVKADRPGGERDAVPAKPVVFIESIEEGSGGGNAEFWR